MGSFSTGLLALNDKELLWDGPLKAGADRVAQFDSSIKICCKLLGAWDSLCGKRVNWVLIFIKAFCFKTKGGWLRRLDWMEEPGKEDLGFRIESSSSNGRKKGGAF